jgi:putative ABC transport system substrate-binding protein
MIGRRELITLLGGAVAWPLAARAQQPTMPVIGFLHSTSPDGNADRVRAFREGLKEAGIVEGENVAVEYRTNTMSNESTLRDLEAAARSLGLQIQVHNASTSHDIDAVFETFVRERPAALFVAIAAFFVDRRVQLALQAMIHKVPVTYPVRDFAEAGGLMSYGASLRDSIRQSGLYAGRILKGAKPADLPVLQSTKFELVINHQTARILGLTVSPMLLARADEVIE